MLHGRIARKRMVGGIAVALVGFGVASVYAASNGVTAEAVDVYCNANGGNCSSIICIAEADNFRNGLLNKSGTIYRAGARWTNKLVYDTDFFDPERTGQSFDNDTFEFDAAGNGLAYVCLHGTCNDMPGTTCTVQSQCGAGVCVGDGPFSSSGHCANNVDRLLITTADAFGNHHGGAINYSTGLVKWGESPQSGSFAGAGTNGGINFGLLSNSCGVRPGFMMQQTLPLFAGMTVLGIVMPVTFGSDDVDAPVRGTALSNAYAVNPNGSIGRAWADSIVGIPQNDGGPCGPGNYTNGGGRGITGCGAQLTVTADISQATVLWDRDTENWNQAVDDNNDSLGTQWFGWWYHCNYDCNTFPFLR